MIVVDHVYNQTIEIPFEPTTFEVFVEFTNSWVAQTQWSKTQGSRTINGVANVVYWSVAYTGQARSQADYRLS